MKFKGDDIYIIMLDKNLLVLLWENLKVNLMTTSILACLEELIKDEKKNCYN